MTTGDTAIKRPSAGGRRARHDSEVLTGPEGNRFTSNVTELTVVTLLFQHSFGFGLIFVTNATNGHGITCGQEGDKEHGLGEFHDGLGG